MTSYRQQRKARNRLKFSAMGRASQRAQSYRRNDGTEERIRALAESDAENLPRKQGDALGCLQWTDFRTGQVRRWTVRIGDRRDRITLHAPDGRATESHGWSWVMAHLRGFLAGTKTA